MCEENSCSGGNDCTSEHLARMDETAVEDAFGDDLETSYPVGAIKPEDDEPFTHLILEEKPEVADDVLR